MIDPEFLRLLCCPETHQALQPADNSVVERLNRAIAAGTLRNRNDQIVSEKIDGGLIRSDGLYLYAVRQDIPVLLVEEALPLAE